MNQHGAVTARWEVLWVADGKIIRRPFGADYVSASQLYHKALAKGKRAATLRCANVAFPPPDKYADREKVVLGRSKRTGKLVHEVRITDPRTYHVRMLVMNRKGKWWCPYCMKMLRFVKREGFRVEGQWVAEPHLACPLCGIPHRQVMKYNPMAARVSMTSRVRDPNRSRKRARRRQRQREEEE